MAAANTARDDLCRGLAPLDSGRPLEDDETIIEASQSHGEEKKRRVGKVTEKGSSIDSGGSEGVDDAIRSADGSHLGEALKRKENSTMGQGEKSRSDGNKFEGVQGGEIKGEESNAQGEEGKEEYQESGGQSRDSEADAPANHKGLFGNLMSNLSSIQQHVTTTVQEKISLGREGTAGLKSSSSSPCHNNPEGNKVIAGKKDKFGKNISAERSSLTGTVDIDSSTASAEIGTLMASASRGTTQSVVDVSVGSMEGSVDVYALGNPPSIEREEGCLVEDFRSEKMVTYNVLG